LLFLVFRGFLRIPAGPHRSTPLAPSADGEAAPPLRAQWAALREPTLMAALSEAQRTQVCVWMHGVMTDHDG
jgi:hypothetical protein